MMFTHDDAQVLEVDEGALDGAAATAGAGSKLLGGRERSRIVVVAGVAEQHRQDGAVGQRHLARQRMVLDAQPNETGVEGAHVAHTGASSNSAVMHRASDVERYITRPEIFPDLGPAPL
jgi:hypothetical protein